MKKHDFTKNIEKMVDPIEVGTIHYMQSYTKTIPKHLQDKMISKGAKKNPYMGFVVEPYSFFLCYELTDVEAAQNLLPDNYKLIPTKILEADTEAKYYCIFGSFNVHTSAFWGTRMEFSIIAENQDTGLLSWVIIDYDTNTVSFDQKRGLIEGNTKECVFTTNFDGEVIVDIKGKKARELVVESRLQNGVRKNLDQRLWLEGNLSVAYGKDLTDAKGEAFAIMFNPKEVASALTIPLTDVNIQANTWYPNLFAKTPTHAICFPYTQHFLSDSPGHFSNIKNEGDMQAKIETIDFDSFPKYSSKPIKKAMQIGQLLSFLLIIILIVLYIVK